MNPDDYIVWLQTILKARAISQTHLAGELGVTHAALNRWLHRKAKPHARTLELIRDLYRKCAFFSDLEKGFPAEKWQKKFAGLKGTDEIEGLLHRRDVYDDSLLNLIYHSNKIEGSTLSLRDTQRILFDNQVVASHSMIEHLEVSNHRLAFRKILDGVQEDSPLTVSFVLELHATLMNGILDDAGRFRTHPVRIVGARVVPPNFIKVPEKMAGLCEQMQATDDPIGMILQHAWFEAIHPFADGNGRLGRLLLNYQLLRSGFPLAIIRSERKRLYYEALERAQVQREFEPLVDFVFEELSSSPSE